MENKIKICGETPRYAVINEYGKFVGSFCVTYEEALDSAYNTWGKCFIYELKEVMEYGHLG